MTFTRVDQVPCGADSEWETVDNSVEQGEKWAPITVVWKRQILKRSNIKQEAGQNKEKHDNLMLFHHIVNKGVKRTDMKQQSAYLEK